MIFGFRAEVLGRENQVAYLILPVAYLVRKSVKKLCLACTGNPYMTKKKGAKQNFCLLST